MKTEMDHLPETKQDELNQICAVIRHMCDDVEMVVLFGSYARGDWKEESDLAPDRKSGHKSDYDILVVTREKSTARNAIIWNEMTKACNDLDQSTHARIISDDIEHRNIQLAEGHYFYSDIKKEGCLLYNSGNVELAEKRDLNAWERKRIAQDHFDHWFRRAKEFYDDFVHNMGLERYEKAAFELHQATEESYKTILLVFTNYNPSEHYLGLLSDMATDEDACFRNIFPHTTEEEQRCFRLLDYAYIGGRYDPEFRISKTDLEVLEKNIKKLLELTEKRCTERIQSLG